jgi:peptidoglycan/LPS O-acetylase OafA/YrhL
VEACIPNTEVRSVFRECRTRKFRLQKITLRSFQRITSGGAYIPEIDGLRFIAIVSVMWLHCYGELLNRLVLGSTVGRIAASPIAMEGPQGFLRLLGHGGYGVNVFFAISGFILALPFARQHLRGGRVVQLRSYFLRRLTRLEPPYILALLIRTLLLCAVGTRQIHYLLVHLLASVFYVHNISYGVASTIEAVSWTLEIEVQFYCLAPLLALIYKMPRAWLRRTLLISVIAGATPLQRAFLPGWHGQQNAGVFTLSILANFQFFLVGLLIADFYVEGWERIPASRWWDAVCFPFWFAFFWLRPDGFRFLGPVLLPVLFVGAFKGSVIRAILRYPLVSTIGGMCYSIYLTHRTTILVLEILLVRFHLPFVPWLVVSLLVVTPAAMAVGAVYFLLIERPCMDPNWPRKLATWFRSGRQVEEIEREA